MASDLRVEFVLVRPRRPANVAAACRAMKNMGFRRLVLVSPPEGLDAPDARALAYGAWDVLDEARVAPDLRAAVVGANLVVGTSGRVAGTTLTPRALAESVGRLERESGVAIVFGPEDQGLSREELGLCHLRVRIPSDAAQPSLNLAQAVLVLAYELSLAGGGDAPAGPLPAAPPRAPEFEEAMDALREALLSIGYLNAQNPQPIFGEIRDLLWRAGPTARDLALLRGLARQVGWAGRRGPGDGRGPLGEKGEV